MKLPHMPRGKMGNVAATFLKAAPGPRGETPIVAAPPPFPTRDFVPWRFSDAGRRSAWLASWVPASENLHKAQNLPPALQKRSREVDPPARCNPIPMAPPPRYPTPRPPALAHH